MKPIFNKNGEIIDWSDEGQFKKQLESYLNLKFFIKKLPQRHRDIIKLKMAGFKNNEIVKKLAISYTTFWRIMKGLKDKCAKIK